MLCQMCFHMIYLIIPLWFICIFLENNRILSQHYRTQMAVRRFHQRVWPPNRFFLSLSVSSSLHNLSKIDAYNFFAFFFFRFPRVIWSVLWLVSSFVLHLTVSRYSKDLLFSLCIAFDFDLFFNCIMSFIWKKCFRLFKNRTFYLTSEKDLLLS